MVGHFGLVISGSGIGSPNGKEVSNAGLAVD
jgi:hypothetical protein